MIVPFPPGGPSDVVARIMADGMSHQLGHTMVIENVAGAGGTLGTARAAAAEPDGDTLLGAGMGSHVAAPALFPNLKDDLMKDFEPIGMASNSQVAVVAKKNFPAKDLKELIAYVRKNGAGVKQAHGGIGAASHMACLLFNSEAGLQPNSVPYRGTGPALNDLVGGHVDYFCEQVVSIAPSGEGRHYQGLCGVGQCRARPRCRTFLRPRKPACPRTRSASGARFRRRRGRRSRSSPSSARR